VTKYTALALMVSYGLIAVPVSVSVVDALIDYPEIVMVYDYCLSHTDEILAGDNPVQDLIDAHLIPESVPSSEENETETDFAGKTCEDVTDLKEQFEAEQMQSDARDKIMRAWGID
jgi:hypothetical protein